MTAAEPVGEVTRHHAGRGLPGLARSDGAHGWGTEPATDSSPASHGAPASFGQLVASSARVAGAVADAGIRGGGGVPRPDATV